MTPTEIATCDNGDHPVRLDRNGYWAGDDGSSDCPDDDRGHLVDGRVRA